MFLIYSYFLPIFSLISFEEMKYTNTSITKPLRRDLALNYFIVPLPRLSYIYWLIHFNQNITPFYQLKFWYDCYFVFFFWLEYCFALTFWKIGWNFMKKRSFNFPYLSRQSSLFSLTHSFFQPCFFELGL